MRVIVRLDFGAPLICKERSKEGQVGNDSTQFSCAIFFDQATKAKEKDPGSDDGAILCYYKRA